MHCLDDGHNYELQYVEGTGTDFVRFCRKVSGKLTVNGTTNEEVLLMLIHRLTEINKELGCIENEGAILCLRLALGWLEERTINRTYRKVEGTDNP